MKLLVATKNVGKLREYQELLQELPVQLVSLADEQIEMDVEESGQTFAQNAMLKAQAYAAQSGLATLADDSGLEVDALNGEPGVFSARYGGPQSVESASCRLADVSRYSLLLDKMQNVPWEQRGARFRCVIALALPGCSVPLVAGNGRCEGFIARVPCGEHGFGYDPIFFVPQFGQSMAELPSEIKNRISHRARAVETARNVLAQQFFPDSTSRQDADSTSWLHTSEVRIRTVRPSDAADLQRHCYPDKSLRFVEGRLAWAISGLDGGKLIPLVAEAVGTAGSDTCPPEVIAYIKLRLRSTVGELSSLIVAEPLRGRGLATALLNVGREVARDHGARWLTVAVEPEAKRLQSFYRNRGFASYRAAKTVEHGYTGPVVYMKQLIT